jgi:type VI secretion system secreted protein VgrG
MPTCRGGRLGAIRRPPARPPTAHGTQSAIVIGADGNDQPNGADELYCDRLGGCASATTGRTAAMRPAGCASPSARPAAAWAASSCRASGRKCWSSSSRTTSTARSSSAPSTTARARAALRRRRAASRPVGEPIALSIRARPRAFRPRQPGRRQQPVWHGASGDSAGHRNGAAQWGIRSKEFGGSGYNQLLFDDTDGQGRVQLRSTHAASELNLGHLIHAADNYRGSFRGLGAELRTDAYGAVRAGAGCWCRATRSTTALPRAIRLARTRRAIACWRSGEAGRVLQLGGADASDGGTGGAPGRGESQRECARRQGCAAEGHADRVSGMVGQDSLMRPWRMRCEKHQRGARASCRIRRSDHRHRRQGGLRRDAGQSLQLANGETVALMSGQDTQFVTGGQMRVHSGQAIGVLGGAVKAGRAGSAAADRWPRTRSISRRRPMS